MSKPSRHYKELMEYIKEEAPLTREKSFAIFGYAKALYVVMEKISLDEYDDILAHLPVPVDEFDRIFI